MAAHTFELSPNWMRSGLIAQAAPSESSLLQQPLSHAAPRRSFTAYWLALPVAAVLAGLAIFFSPTAADVAPRHDTPPAARPTSVSTSHAVSGDHAISA